VTTRQETDVAEFLERLPSREAGQHFVKGDDTDDAIERASAAVRKARSRATKTFWINYHRLNGHA
jgi:hypothetical protein